MTAGGRVGLKQVAEEGRSLILRGGKTKSFPSFRLSFGGLKDSQVEMPLRPKFKQQVPKLLDLYITS